MPVPRPQRRARRSGSREIWESERTRPAYAPVGGEMGTSLEDCFDGYFGRCMEHPYLPAVVIRERQLARIKELVEMAYAEIPVYRDKYMAAGFHPDDLRTHDDIQKIPVISKPELIAAFPGAASIPASARKICSRRARPGPPAKPC